MKILLFCILFFLSLFSVNSLFLQGTIEIEGELSSIVTITNNSSDTANNVVLKIPLYYSDSPYQEINIKDNFGEIKDEYIEYFIEEISPSETVKISVMYEVVNIEQSKTKFKARYKEKLAKILFSSVSRNYEGNCRELTLVYINKCKKYGLEAREVLGFYKASGVMNSGSLTGTRHSWAEVKIDGNWVPVDIPFLLFKDGFENHIIEGYHDRGVKVLCFGGKLEVEWDNYFKRR